MLVAKCKLWLKSTRRVGTKPNIDVEQLSQSMKRNEFQIKLKNRFEVLEADGFDLEGQWDEEKAAQ